MISKSLQKQAARFADHIYCDCKRATAEQRRAVAQHHRTKCIATRMKQERAAAVQKAQLAAICAAERGGSNSAVAIASGPAASAIVTKSISMLQDWNDKMHIYNYAGFQCKVANARALLATCLNEGFTLLMQHYHT